MPRGSNLAAPTLPAADALTEAYRPQGLALSSMRWPGLSRYRIRVSLTGRVDDGSDDTGGDQWRLRLPDEATLRRLPGTMARNPVGLPY